MKAYLIYKDEKSAKFWQIELDETDVTVCYGKIGTDGQSKTKSFPLAEKAQQNYEQQIFKKVDEGYVAKVPYKIVEANTLQLSIEGEIEGSHVLVFDSGTNVKHNLILDYNQGFLNNAEHKIAGIYVKGDFTIEGTVFNNETDEGPFLIVEGNLIAKAIIGGGSEIIINKNLEVDYLIHRYNHGYIRVDGETHSKIAISEDYEGIKADKLTGFYANLSISQKVQVYIFGTADNDTYSFESIFKNHKTPHIDIEKYIQNIYQGKDLFLEKPLTDTQVLLKSLEKELKNPESVKQLNLSNKNLVQLPEGLFVFTNLEGLNLGSNEFTQLPNLSFFTSLKQLDLSNNKLDHFPKEIKRLQHLESLSISQNKLEDLSGIEELTNLKSIQANSNKLTEFPRQLFTLKNLEELSLSNNHLPSLPSSIGQLSSLKFIDVKHNHISTLPEEIVNCKSLQNINLANQCSWVGYSEKKAIKAEPLNFLEVLNSLESLKTFNVNSNYITTFPDKDFVSQQLQEIIIEKTLIKSSSHPKIKIAQPENLLEEILQRASAITKKEPRNEYKALTWVIAVKIAGESLDPGEHLDAASKMYGLLTFEVNHMESVFEEPYPYLQICNEQLSFLPSNAITEDLSIIVEMTLEEEAILYDGYPEILKPNKENEDYQYQRLNRFFEIKSRNPEKIKKLKIYIKDLSRFPESICKLTYLTSLEMEHCELTSIPKEIKNLQKLEKLLLCNNKIRHLPIELAEIKNLIFFDIKRNPIKEIPEELKKIRVLRK